MIKAILTQLNNLTEITNACKILYTFIKLTSNKTDNSTVEQLGLLVMIKTILYE